MFPYTVEECCDDSQTSTEHETDKSFPHTYEMAQMYKLLFLPLYWCGVKLLYDLYLIQFTYI